MWLSDCVVFSVGVVVVVLLSCWGGVGGVGLVVFVLVGVWGWCFLGNV